MELHIDPHLKGLAYLRILEGKYWDVGFEIYGRDKMTWLNDVMESTKEIESPRSFFYWSALAAISAVVRKNVYIDKGKAYNLYPNIYVMLLAKSGTRKGYPINLARQVVAAVGNTRIISGRNSIQAVIKDLSLNAVNPNGGEPIKTACGFLVSGEFATFIIQDESATSILTDLYDTHYHEKEWKNTLKGSGVEKLREPVLTLLGGSNPTLFNEVVPQHAIQGGFLGRLMIVEARKRALKNPLLTPIKNPPDVEKLAEYLREIAKLHGPFTFTSEAKLHYEAWYDKFEPEEMEDPTGTAERINDTILKVAMLLSLSRSPDLIIAFEDIQEAIKACEIFIRTAIKSQGGAGRNQYGPQTFMIMKELAFSPNLTVAREKILQKYYGELNAQVLDIIVDHLLQGDIITREVREGRTTYTLGDKFANEFKATLQRMQGES